MVGTWKNFASSHPGIILYLSGLLFFDCSTLQQSLGDPSHYREHPSYWEVANGKNPALSASQLQGNHLLSPKKLHSNFEQYLTKISGIRKGKCNPRLELVSFWIVFRDS